MAALGYPDQAHAWRKRAILEAEKSRHRFSQAYASAHNLYALYLLDEVEMIKELASGAIVLSTEQGFPFYTTFAQFIEGWAFARCGDLEDGIVQMRKGIEGFRATGTLLFMPAFFVLLADGLGRSAQFEEALQLIEKSLDQIERWGERQFEADAYRVQSKPIASTGRLKSGRSRAGLFESHRGRSQPGIETVGTTSSHWSSASLARSG